MQAARLLFVLLLVGLLGSSCARRTKATAPVAVETVTETKPAVEPAAARDLTDVMTDELKLTAPQQLKVRQILNSTVDQVNAARAQHAGNNTALMAELKRINASSESQLKATLTAEQYKGYQTKKSAMRAQMQARKTPPSGK